MLFRITIAIDKAELRKQLQLAMARPDFLIQAPAIQKNLWDRVTREPSDVLVISQSLLPHRPKMKFETWTNLPDSPAMVVLSDTANPAIQASLLAAGCDAVLHSSLAVEQLQAVIELMVLKRCRLPARYFFTTHPLAAPCLADFVSESPGMTQFMKLVPRVVRNDTTLLIEGETGVGKERLASAIHAEGPRSAGRFVALNCGALPEHLLESELFGHVRGAFTGATNAHRGWFEVAHKGTLFLDEVGEIPLHLQVKLLRVLQEREIQPVGSEKSFKVDVRVIAASNRSLETEVEAGRFRRDLYHRLSIVTVTLPPLRERPEDIPGLIQRLINHNSKEIRRSVAGIDQPALKAMCGYAWPGNVRELNNVIERAILLCDDTSIGLEDLPESVTSAALGVIREYAPGRKERRLPQQPIGHSEAPEGGGNLEAPGSSQLMLPDHWLHLPLNELRSHFFPDLERQYIEGLLIAMRGRVGEAAKRAGLPERTMYEKMKLYSLRKEDYRQVREKQKPAIGALPAAASPVPAPRKP